MIGLLPDVVRLNQLRGRQAADKGQRLLASASEVEAALAEVARSDEAARYFDVDRMREVWHNLQDNVDRRNTGLAGTVLLRGLMAGLFVAGLYDRKNQDATDFSTTARPREKSL